MGNLVLFQAVVSHCHCPHTSIAENAQQLLISKQRPRDSSVVERGICFQREEIPQFKLNGENRNSSLSVKNISGFFATFLLILYEMSV